MERLLRRRNGNVPRHGDVFLISGAGNIFRPPDFPSAAGFFSEEGY